MLIPFLVFGCDESHWAWLLWEQLRPVVFFHGGYDVSDPRAVFPWTWGNGGSRHKDLDSLFWARFFPFKVFFYPCSHAVLAQSGTSWFTQSDFSKITFNQRGNWFSHQTWGHWRTKLGIYSSAHKSSNERRYFQMVYLSITDGTCGWDFPWHRCGLSIRILVELVRNWLDLPSDSCANPAPLQTVQQVQRRVQNALAQEGPDVWKPYRSKI